MGNDFSCSVDGSFYEEVEGDRVIVSGENLEAYSGKSLILACGESLIELSQDGTIRIAGKHIKLDADRVDIN